MGIDTTSSENISFEPTRRHVLLHKSASNSTAMSLTETELGLWLKHTGADKEVKIGDKPDLELLKKLVKYQLKEVWYQNYDLLQNRKELDFSPKALVNRMLVEGRRGMCFEGCELMALVLTAFKFDARRIPTFTTVNGQSYEEGAVLDHNVIVVLLDGKKYLVDIIFSFNSIREPLEFSFEKTEEIILAPGVEQYRLEVYDDHCHLHMWLKGAWAPMYHIHLPLPYMSSDQLARNFKTFLYSPNTIMIRDFILKIGRLTETGRIGFVGQFDSKNLKGSGPYTMLFCENFQPARPETITYEEFRDGIKKYIGVTLNDEHFTP